MAVETVECAYCRCVSAVKLHFPSEYSWNSVLTTDQHNESCNCNMFVCFSCGRVMLLDYNKEEAK